MRVTPLAARISFRPGADPRRLCLTAALTAAPTLSVAQATSPFLTGATALQTNILAWLTPLAIILVMGLGAMAMANRMRSELAERMRAEYRRRVELRRERSLGEARQGTEAGAPDPPRHDLEEVRREARRAWLELRRQSAGHTAESEREPTAVPQAEDDLSL